MLKNNFVPDEIIYPSNAQIKNYQTKLISKGIVDITDCFTTSIRTSLVRDACTLFDDQKKRKDFFSEHTKTPRHMYTVGERTINHYSKVISDFYYAENTIGLLTEIAQEKVDFLPWTGERFVINGLINNQDTHGWHWDDYAYALVFIAVCPPEEGGGRVECIPHTNWIKNNPNIRGILAVNPIQSYYFNPGSFYLMKSDTTLHRVSKLISPYHRISIAMSYCNEADLIKNIDHKTVLDLYE